MLKWFISCILEMKHNSALQIIIFLLVFFITVFFFFDKIIFILCWVFVVAAYKMYKYIFLNSTRNTFWIFLNIKRQKAQQKQKIKWRKCWGISLGTHDKATQKASQFFFLKSIAIDLIWNLLCKVAMIHKGTNEFFLLLLTLLFPQQRINNNIK